MPGTSQLFPASAPPEVALPWLMRLRWVAVCGQTSTLALVGLGLKIDLPWLPLLGLIGTTLLTNALLYAWRGQARGFARLLVPGLLVLDTLLFTALLYFTGGPENPFSLLYVIHVAMATVTLSLRWTWGMVFLSAACYGALFWDHVPLPLERVAGNLPLYQAGTWFCMTLVAGVLAYFVGRVILALRERESELATARSVAARNERLASLTTLATGAAHELGTPLGTIAVVAKELERAAERLNEEGIVEDAKLIRDQVDRCRTILDRMTARSDGPAGAAPEPVASAELLSHLREVLGPAGDRVELEPGSLEELRAPRRDLEEALLPLVANALQAGEAGVVTLGVTREDARLRFSVRDRGPGMDAETLSRAGEPFYTTKPPGQGTGLGLHLVRLLAERLGGRLELSSHDGGGTLALLELPDR